MGGRSGQLASDLIRRVREQVSAGASRNQFVDLLEAGGVPGDRLTWLAGEQFRIVGSDQRIFALLAARFPTRRRMAVRTSAARGWSRDLPGQRTFLVAFRGPERTGSARRVLGQSERGCLPR